MKVLFVINPKSGRQPVANLESQIAHAAAQDGFEYHVHMMGASDEEQQISRLIKTYRPEIVAGAGGDGTINLLACILKHTSVKLLILPMGSANGMARELQLGNHIDALLKLVSSGKTIAVDLLQVNGHICIHLADVGLNARIVKRFELDTRRGLLTYARHLFREVFLLKTYKFIIRSNDLESLHKAVSLTLANASRYGTGAVINPVGRINDGKFELVIVKPFPKLYLFTIAWKMFRGTLQTSDYVKVISCSEAHIISSRKTTLQIDGEVIGKVKRISVEILPKALQVIVPPASL